jgi:hypothetical protein
MSSTSDDRHPDDQSAVPLFTLAGRRMPDVAAMLIAA